MFGQPTWFRPKSIGWGLTPVTWKGWAYTGAWVAAIAGPFALLLSRHQPLEAMAWMSLGLGALVADVWQILRTMKGQTQTTKNAPTVAAQKRDDNVLYILDSGPAPVATRSYNLQVRR